MTNPISSNSSSGLTHSNTLNQKSVAKPPRVKPQDTVSNASENTDREKKTNNLEKKGFFVTIKEAIYDILKAIKDTIKVIFYSIIPIENLVKKEEKQDPRKVELKNLKRKLELVDDISKALAEERANNLDLGFDPYEKIANEVLEKEHTNTLFPYFSQKPELSKEEKIELGKNEFKKDPSKLKAFLKDYYKKKIDILEAKLKTKS